MKVKYYEINLEGETSSSIIFLKNKNLWFFISPKKKSRYFGGFIFHQNQALRFIDDINFNDEFQEIHILSPYEVIIYFKNNQAYLNLNNDGLEITFSSYHEVNLTFDIKDIFQNDEFKRKIKLEKISSTAFLVEEFLEGSGLIKLLIEADAPLNYKETWIEKFFDFDQKRNSFPINWWVFDGIYGKVRELKIKIVFPTTNENEYNADKHIVKTVLTTSNKNQKTLSIINFLLSRLDSLILDNYLPAGFPWFYENWYRDELLSLFLINQTTSLDNNFFKSRIKFYLYNLENTWDKNKETASLLGVDTFLLFILNLPQEFLLIHFNLLEKYLKKWQEKFNLENLPSCSTWMDTLERKTALEIEALLIKTLRKFAKINKNYVPLANSLKERIIKKIKENPVDVNLVFSFLFLEDIFSKNEWKNFFEKLLKESYLSWGGLATLSLNNPRFLDEDDGEKTQAYHQGDSWYFINNLLAYSLLKIDYKKFKEFIEKIIKSSLIDLFFDGALGWSSEISSAKERRSEGSLVQTWSIASLIFLLSSLQNFNISLKSLSNSHNIISVKS